MKILLSSTAALMTLISLSGDTYAQCTPQTIALCSSATGQMPPMQMPNLYQPSYNPPNVSQYDMGPLNAMRSIQPQFVPTYPGGVGYNPYNPGAPLYGQGR